MKRIFSKTLAAAATLACSTAFAGGGFITFDATAPSIFTNGDVTVDGLGVITTLGNGGFDGQIDGVGGCVVVCPVGNATQFYSALNDGGLNVKLSGGGLSMLGLDFGFVVPVPVIVAGSVGKLVVTGFDANGVGTMISQDFSAQDANGDFGFTHWDFASSFANTWFSSVNINACLYDANGDCVNPANNLAEFAVDNIAFLPEPGSLALAGVSLAGLLAAGRRRKSA